MLAERKEKTGLQALTLLLFERMGILLTLTFILTRIPLFRQLLDREVRISTAVSFSLVFGLFGIAGTYAGVIVADEQLMPAFWMEPLNRDEVIANSTLVGVVIGGLLGGPIVGLGAGFIAGIHALGMGGAAAAAMGLSAPLTGLLAGYVARFFSQERVISPSKAIFIGMFAPILQMALILILTNPPEIARQIVNEIGIPMVLTNSISIAIFTTMIRVALQEEERSAAIETERALKIAELLLPHLKQGLSPQTAETVANLLRKELKAAAVAVSDQQQFLAHVGLEAGHHLRGQRLDSELARRALSSGHVQVGLSREQLACPRKDCQLAASILIPIKEAGTTVGLLVLYYKRPEQIRKVEEVLAVGLSNLLSNQLTLDIAEKMVNLMREAELRMLQAQINPHFLFNTLNSIVTLIRVDPDLARHMTIQLASYMRLTIRITASQLIPLHQELDHLQAYVDIIKVRFAEQLTITCQFASERLDVFIPPGTLQPLVENCIQHGLRKVTSGGWIGITVRTKRSGVEIRIEDNGTGIPGEIRNQLGQAPIKSTTGNGIGVYNVNQRLIRLLGPQAHLRFKNKPDGGALIAFTIPRGGKMVDHTRSDS
ncbi:LytS/YhcK type 5TM receptor domain-containing protein [Brevibacillus fulvus]|uniref:histidine kinase n=1 Tax=Brevibacillus fulvus TaxID=1125967 RepID=A0A938XYZ8_9BACL|nr:LytS/YhcK type 5TM receptor domain-containing protein [Brevibacillus fulvus]MBM7588477.1 two-component system sensor histidine kinase LytS [Brevibacillus fulvus]